MNRLFIVICFMLFTSLVNASPVNINTANADAIATALKGIGPSKAAAIVEFRVKNGPFLMIDDLVNVKGIGQKTVEKNRSDIIIEVEDKS